MKTNGWSRNCLSRFFGKSTHDPGERDIVPGHNRLQQLQRVYPAPDVVLNYKKILTKPLSWLGLGSMPPTAPGDCMEKNYSPAFPKKVPRGACKDTEP
ncbi:hypothetical protein [Lunatibacter salilacus]|uniref:hypothetical protein n=1 Tax=Lunatibacter salilacus TaxID=2483804 RepID=UPI00131E0C26|nr:hypothetical protein [Lunatibacter salilacus]